jgi:hypothetical protein
MSLEILECENKLTQIKHLREELLKKKEDLNKAFNENKYIQSFSILINSIDKIIEVGETNINQSKEKLKTSI